MKTKKKRRKQSLSLGTCPGEAEDMQECPSIYIQTKQLITGPKLGSNWWTSMQPSNASTTQMAYNTEINQKFINKLKHFKSSYQSGDNLRLNQIIMHFNETNQRSRKEKRTSKNFW